MSEGKKTAREIIEGYDGPAVRIMEVCGTHTHEIFRLGIRKLLPKQVELISGPVSSELLEDLEPGDYVMVHAGIAIAKITGEDDSETDQLMEELL